MTRIAPAALAALASGLLLWAAPYFPLILSLPIALIWARQGQRWGLITGLVSLLLCAVIGGLPGAFLYLVSGALPGALFGWSWQEQASPLLALVRGGTGFLLLLVLTMAFGQAVGLQVQPFGPEQFEALKAAFVANGLYSAELGQLLETVQKTMQFSAPAVLAIFAALNALGATLLATWLGPKVGVAVRPLPPFRTWRLPRWLFWVYLPLWLFMGDDLVGRVFYNLFFLLNLAFMVQGLAVLYAFVVRRLGRVISTGLSALIFFLTPLTNLLAIVGILDGAFNFRARFQNGGRR